jgi:cobalt-zinc-cadmium resistance protein CzcA
VLAAALIVIGGRSLSLPIDAFPDTTPVQVQINTTAGALNPQETEAQITVPVELAVSGLPGLQNVRSISKFGLSQVVATFDDSIDIFKARQLIMERLQTVELPEGLERPQLGPIATGLGEVFHYVVRSSDTNRTPTELRVLQDWVVKPELRKVPGVAEVNTWGGFEKQYHVVVETDRLIKYRLTFEDLIEALQANNQNVGGGQIVRGGESLLVHGVGLTTNVQEIANIVITSHDGTPVRVRDVATVKEDHEIRRGAVTADGRGEAVLGLGFMLMGENSAVVTHALKAKLAEVQKFLPPDVKLEVLYDRTELVDNVIRTVATQPAGRRAAGHRHSVCVPGQPAGRIDRGGGDSAFDALRGQPHAAGGHRRQPVEPRRGGLRPHRGWRGGDDGKRDAAMAAPSA